MATDRTAEVTWHGDLMSGSGRVDSVTSGALGSLDVDWGARSEDGQKDTSPEELIAAAHATCLSMALSHGLGQGGHPADELFCAPSEAMDKPVPRKMRSILRGESRED